MWTAVSTVCSLTTLKRTDMVAFSNLKEQSALDPLFPRPWGLAADVCGPPRQPLSFFSQAVSSFAVLDPFHRAMSLMTGDQCCLCLSFEVHLADKATDTHRNNHICQPHAIYRFFPTKLHVKTE